MTNKTDTDTLDDADFTTADAEAASTEHAPEAQTGKKPSRKEKKKAARQTAAQSKENAPADEVEPDVAEAAAADAETAQVYKDRLLRLQADFDNFRKRTQRERDELYRMANEDLMSDLIPVVDHIQLALDAAGDDAQSKALADGVQLVMSQFENTLKKFGLAPIDAVGQPFDPNLHEALSQAPSDAYHENVVAFQHRRGYQLGSKLLRPAQVIVSSGPGPDAGDAQDAAAAGDEAGTLDEES